LHRGYVETRGGAGVGGHFAQILADRRGRTTA
jgi:hypothetical protein